MYSGSQTLGFWLSGSRVQDAIETEASLNNILYTREQSNPINYKGVALRHFYYTGFLIEHRLILEAKAAEGAITNECITKTLYYQKVYGCNVGLIVNFGKKSLE